MSYPTPEHCGKRMEILVMSSGGKDTAIVWKCKCGAKQGGRINNITGALTLNPPYDDESN